MTPKVIGWIRWVESKNDMVPYKTTDRRLVVFVDAAAADFDRGYMEVIDPITAADRKDIVARFELTGVYRVGLAELRRTADDKRRRYENSGKIREPQPMQKRRKAPQSDAKQLALF
jgi:hypothetical protein